VQHRTVAAGRDAPIGRAVWPRSVTGWRQMRRLVHVVTRAEPLFGRVVLAESQAPNATHADHAHQHDAGCGHVSVDHDNHTNYIHDGHARHAHDDDWDEASSRMSSTRKTATAMATTVATSPSPTATTPTPFAAATATPHTKDSGTKLQT
jgi:hypothetical protein